MVIRGYIRRFAGSWHSGIGYLEVECSNGEVQIVPCDNAQTVRQLDDCFGGVIQEGRIAKMPEIASRTELLLRMDRIGILESFTPYADWLANGGPEVPGVIEDVELEKILGRDITI